MKQIHGGVLVPVCSPCGLRGEFLEKEFAFGLEDALKENVDGVYVCGGTGDGMNMPIEERKAACRIAVEKCRAYDKICLLQVGAHTLRDALILAEDGVIAGVDGISSVPLPGYAHPEQMQYYRALSQAAPDVQIILYYMPQPGAAFTLSQVAESLTVPGVRGIKCSTNDFFFTQQLMWAKPAGKVLFNGKDEYLAPAVVHGADGGIGMWSTVFPKSYSNIYHLAREGRLADAFDLQSRLNRLCCRVMENGLLESYACIRHYLGKYDRVFRAPQPQYNASLYDRFIPENAQLIQSLVLGE